MLHILYFLVTFVLKIVIYLFLLFVVFVIGLKLWLEPVKGVCKCKVKLNGKVALVTGGNSGIGLETARDLARRGARVIIACRNAKLSQEAIADIVKTTGNTNVEFRHLDLSQFSSVRSFAEEFNRTVDRLDILVNNAGCAGLKRTPTVDGIDKVIQINYLGAFLLTNLVLDKLILSKPSRIVNVSSYAHAYFPNFDPDDLAGLKTKGYWTRYCNSKLCQVLWTRALAKRLPAGVTANVLHPGVVKTNIFEKMPDGWRWLLLTVIQLVFKTAREGAQTSVHLCVAPELEDATGGYYVDCQISQSSKLSRDDALADKVWNDSIFLTKS